MTVTVIPNKYGVTVGGDIRATLDDEERQYYEQAVFTDMARCLAHHVLETKRAEIRTVHPTPVDMRHELELYVFTPAEFHLAVRREAKRYMDLMNRYPYWSGPSVETKFKG